MLKYLVFLLLSFSAPAFSASAEFAKYKFDTSPYYELAFRPNAERLGRAMSLGNIHAAHIYMKSAAIQKKAEANGELELRYKAKALLDLEKTAKIKWNASNFNELNAMLASKLGAGKILLSCGIGPQPEAYLAWLKAFFPSYPERSYKAAERAIRKWDIVFSTAIMRKEIEWGNPNDLYAKGKHIYIDTSSWLNYDLPLRNAIIDRLAVLDMNKDKRCSPNCPSALLAFSSKQAAVHENNTKLEKITSKAIKYGMLTTRQVEEIKINSIAGKAALLDKYFDGAAAARLSKEEKLYLSSMRAAAPEELIPNDKKAVFSSMITLAIKNELEKTKTGRRAISGGFKAEPAVLLNRKYSSSLPDGTLQINSELISEYMRIKGYTFASLLTNEKNLKDLAAYIAPLAVYENALAETANKAKAKGIYNPERTQEDEISALGEQSLYIIELQRKYASERRRYSALSAYSEYSHSCAEMASAYRRSQRQFEKEVRLSHAQLPSLSSATANAYLWFSKEQERRAGLSESMLKAESANFIIDYNEAKSLPLQVLSAQVRFLMPEALNMLAADFKRIESYSALHKEAALSSRHRYRSMLMHTLISGAKRSKK